MKIVGVISSARSKGNTVALVREALKGAEESGAEVKEIYLPDYRLEYCTGCQLCMSSGKCCFNDDFEKVKNLLNEADGIILGSPTYAGSINAIMKNFIDRLGLFERMTSSLLGGKYTVGISVCSGMGARKVAKELASAASNSLFRRGYNSGYLGVSAGIRDIREDPEAMGKAHKLGAKLAGDIKSGRKYPLQNPVGRLVNAIMRGNMRRVISANSEGRLKAVYASLSSRNLI